MRLEHQRIDPIVTGPKPGRNEPCPCGSGKKFKKCCNNDTRYTAKRVLEWLMKHDKNAPIDYTQITDADMDDPYTLKVLRERQQEVMGNDEGPAQEVQGIAEGGQSETEESPEAESV